MTTKEEKLKIIEITMYRCKKCNALIDELTYETITEKSLEDYQKLQDLCRDVPHGNCRCIDEDNEGDEGNCICEFEKIKFAEFDKVYALGKSEGRKILKETMKRWQI